ncbi:putative transcription factor/ chromatin remodeling BED-type(Zn) family protein [Tanacetum coccineum]
MASGSAALASVPSSVPSVESTFAGSKRKSKDIGWEYGVIPNTSNPDRIKCTLCGKLISGEEGYKIETTYNTNCRTNYVMLKDNDEAIRSEVRLDSSLEDDEVHDHSMKEPSFFGPMDNFANIVNPEQSLERGKGKKVELSNAIRKERMWMTKKYVARWAYESAIPFHAFEKDSFKMLLEVVGQFGPGLPPPTRYELSTPLLKEEVERTKNLVKRNEKEWKEIGCSIMTDAWSDRKRRSIMNLCVNSRMGTVFLSSKECSGEAHTSEYIYEYVDACIQEVGAEHVVQIVTDNASNNMGAAALLKVTRPKIFWTSCATHTINLMLEGIGALPRFKKILDQAKKLTIFIYSHHKTLAMMRDFTKRKDIVRPGVTRFASSFLTLQSLSEKKEQLRHMFSSTKWEECRFSGTVKGKAAFATVLSTAFWAGVTLCLKVFTPLVKVLRMVDADWKPSMGFVYGEMIKAKEEIKAVLGDNKKAYEPIIKIIEKKMKGRLDTVLHLMAYLLNPYYFYKDTEIQHDPDVSDAVLAFFEIILAGDLEMQLEVTNVEMPKYKKQMDRFGKGPAAGRRKKTIARKRARGKDSEDSMKRQKLEDDAENEDLQEYLTIVPLEGLNVEALLTKYPLMDWEIYTEDSRVYWKIIRVGDHT